jgi:hypothetical protein
MLVDKLGSYYSNNPANKSQDKAVRKDINIKTNDYRRNSL